MKSTMKIYLGRPEQGVLDLEIETMDLGTSDMAITGDGRVVEEPNQRYRFLVELNALEVTR